MVDLARIEWLYEGFQEALESNTLGSLDPNRVSMCIDYAACCRVDTDPWEHKLILVKLVESLPGTWHKLVARFRLERIVDVLIETGRHDLINGEAMMIHLHELAGKIGKQSERASQPS
jgi:hypothetical protein